MSYLIASGMYDWTPTEWAVFVGAVIPGILALINSLKKADNSAVGAVAAVAGKAVEKTDDKTNANSTSVAGLAAQYAALAGRVSDQENRLNLHATQIGQILLSTPPATPAPAAPTIGAVNVTPAPLPKGTP